MKVFNSKNPYNLCHKLFIIIFFFFISIIPHNAKALIIKKKSYLIKEKIIYKDTLSIAVFPLEGNTDTERKFLKPLIKNLIEEKILSYKSYRIVIPIKNFHRSSFKSSSDALPADEDKNALNSRSSAAYQDPAYEITEPVYLKPVIIKGNKITKLIRKEKMGRNPSLLNADIIIKGEVNQAGDNLKVSLLVYNNLYGQKFTINREGAVKNIARFKDELAAEIIKSIMSEYALLNINSKPADALIYIDNRYMGRTDKKNIIIEPGLHDITLIKEKSKKKRLTFSANKDETKSIDIKLGQEDSSYVKKINIESSPPKAGIYIDSSFIGHTPFTLSNLETGTYRIRIDKEGYISKYMTLNIDKDTGGDLVFNLEKGDSNEYYFSRTPFYMDMFRYSLYGTALSTISYIFWGMKIDDEKTRLKRNTDNISKYELYMNISRYTIGATLISAGVFFFLDLYQYDIDIAYYSPDLILANSGQYHQYSIPRFSSSWQNGGIQFTLRF